MLLPAGSGEAVLHALDRLALWAVALPEDAREAALDMQLQKLVRKRWQVDCQALWLAVAPHKPAALPDMEDEEAARTWYSSTYAAQLKRDRDIANQDRGGTRPPQQFAVRLPGTGAGVFLQLLRWAQRDARGRASLQPPARHRGPQGGGRLCSPRPALLARKRVVVLSSLPGTGTWVTQRGAGQGRRRFRERATHPEQLERQDRSAIRNPGREWRAGRGDAVSKFANASEKALYPKKGMAIPSSNRIGVSQWCDEGEHFNHPEGPGKVLKWPGVSASHSKAGGALPKIVSGGQMDSNDCSYVFARLARRVDLDRVFHTMIEHSEAFREVKPTGTGNHIYKVAPWSHMNPYTVRARVLLDDNTSGYVVVGVTDHWLQKAKKHAPPSGAKLYVQGSASIAAQALRMLAARMEEDDFNVPADPRARLKCADGRVWGRQPDLDEVARSVSVLSHVWRASGRFCSWPAESVSVLSHVSTTFLGGSSKWGVE